MDENIVQQVSRIEAEADRIVSEAKRSAAELEEALDSEVEVLRQERERAFRQQMQAFNDQLKRETAGKLDQIERDAKRAMAQLDSLDPAAVERAVELILKHLREEGGCQ